MATRTFMIARNQLLARKCAIRRARQSEAYARDARAMRAKAEDIACRELFRPLFREILNKERDLYRARRAYKLMCLIWGSSRERIELVPRRKRTTRVVLG